MQKKSLGLIETQGLTAGVTAADAAVKSANVELVGYELTRGGGWTTVKILGDVGAVKAAVDAARAAAGAVGRVVGTRVIARPADSLSGLICNENTVGFGPPNGTGPKDPQPPKGRGPANPPKTPEASEPAQATPPAEKSETPEASEPAQATLPAEKPETPKKSDAPHPRPPGNRPAGERRSPPPKRQSKKPPGAK